VLGLEKLLKIKNVFRYMKKTNIAALVIIIVSFVIGIYLYSQMPERMASHWNSAGNVDGYMSKFWGVFLMPIISVGMLLLFLVIPKIDPLKKNIKKFVKYYDWFILLMIAFFFYIYMLTIYWNLGNVFDMGRMIIPAIGILFIYIGVLVENAKRNWFIGIRTPWTLSSDKVWKKTHKIGGKLFKIAGVIALFGIVIPEYSMWLVLIPALFVAIFTLVYSYVLYQKEKH